MSQRYRSSEELLERSLKVIPLGSQTFSKSITQYPVGAAPLFMERASGSHVWDVDGNEYIDFVSSLCAITLGYADPDVDRAVAEQLKKGIIFSLPGRLETEVAERISKMVPCAEMVRFGKNGSDATSGAVRLARAYTGKDRVAVCGYHGWQDWYIGSTARNLGVPKATQDLTHTFTYNDPQSLVTLLEKYPGEFAAVILEPATAVQPANDFLKKVKEITHHHKAVLIFDETVTGFRLSNGGAQQYFGVTPDLATFGKGLANGYPVSAIAGKREIMKFMEEIFFSFTFGGELLSLAAAKATLDKLQSGPILETIFKRGEALVTGVNQLIQKHQLTHTLSLAGLPAWNALTFKDTAPYSLFEIKTYFQQEVYKRGILTIGGHNLSYAHTDADIQKLINVYDEVFGLLSAAISKKNLLEQLTCKPLVPLFKIR